MKPDWLNLVGRNVPRYTSYPTALHFQDRVDDRNVGDWLTALPEGERLSIYVHVPFCEQLCWYCGCATSVPNGYDRIARYVETLHREIDLWASRLPESARAVELHFGGGSPNALSPDDIFSVSEHLRDTFGLDDDAEFSVELDPRSLTPDRIAAFASVGVTRASLGVQTLSPGVQAAINRVQPLSMIEQAASALCDAGILALNADLMYGLPHQTLNDIDEAANAVARLGFDRVAAFGYAHVPWFAKHQKMIAEADLPDLSARVAQAERMAGRLEQLGYVRIGFDHFAKPSDPMARALAKGTLRRNFQGYTTDPCETLIALGPTGISAFRDGFAQNGKDVRTWGIAVEAARLPVVRGTTRTAEDRLRGDVIARLLCDLTVDVSEVAVAHDFPARTLVDDLAALSELAKLGICSIDCTRVTIADEARLLSRLVAEAFDAHSRDRTRHAVAV